ncbi:MAG: flagellin, partial [Ilumatobacteraceae bacterium]
MRINQNVMANNASRNLSATNITLGKSLEKLSSGFRINRAADDAAGLVISQGLRAQISGLKQATRNAQDGISVVQTAEGALNEVHTMLTRMRDLSVQAANTGANDSAARAAAQQELAALRTEIDRISSSTRFGGTALLDGTYGVTPARATGFDANNQISHTAGDDFNININGLGNVLVDLSAMTNVTGAAAASSIQSSINAALAANGNAAINAFAGKVTVSATTVGAGTSLTIEVAGLTAGQTFTLTDGTGTPLADMQLNTGVTAAAGSGGTFQIGASATDTTTLSIGNVSTSGVLSGIATLDISTGAGATAAISALDTAISTVSTTRGNLGALQNRFESMINNLQVTTENLSASESRIRDTELAAEMVVCTKTQ